MARPSPALLISIGALSSFLCALPASRAADAVDDTAAEPGIEPPNETAPQRSKHLTPPLLLPARERAPAEPVNPWFVRPPFTITAGPAADWKLTIYGFAEADAMHDSTRSFNDGLNNNVVAHVLTQANQNPRTQYTIRNSRLGFRAEAPTFGGIKTSGVLEFDLFGNQPTINPGGGAPQQAPGNATTTEAAYFNNAAFRVRHAYVTVQDPIVDVLAGQTYYLLGWQNYFFGATCGFLGIPNELFNRTAQVRLSHTFQTDPVNVDVAAGAFRPAQRDSEVPDGQVGLRVVFNRWKGISTPGSGGTTALPAALAVSAMQRAFKVDPYAPLPAPPIQLLGWAVAFNALIPLIPARDPTDRGNALTVTAEFVTGTGDADQYTGMTAGATMPNLYPLPADTPVNSMGVSVPQTPGSAPLVGLPYPPNVDPGLVAFDSNNFLHTINWETFLVGVQYYLPPTGRLFVSGNYSRGYSSNIASLFHPNAVTQPWTNSWNVFQWSHYLDANVFFDVTPAMRVGASYQRVTQELADETTAHNDRFEMTFLYFL
ncbi:MAG TPA: hypothetical protein VHM31_14100 [Polyangia bacterium]|nr:hypothetical protein [Polyangia bacterium]